MDLPDGYSRDRKSLNFLAKKFVDLMRNADNGVLNLREVSDMLDVRQKRRIYDITNVLEGIGLIHKQSKNCVQWRGFHSPDNQHEVKLALELRKWAEQERYLERMCNFSKQNIRNCMTDHELQTLAYVTRDDLLECFDDDMILTAKNANRVERLPTLEGNLLVYGRGLKVTSPDRPIDVFLVTNDGRSLVQADTLEPEETETKQKDGSTGSQEEPSSPSGKSNKFQSPRSQPPHHYNVQKNAHKVDWKEYKDMANLLLNYRRKNPIMMRRKRLRNFYQAKPPLIKISDRLAYNYMFSLDKSEGILDLFDIPSTGPKK